MQIRIVAPSGPVTEERLDGGIALLEEAGFRVTSSPAVRARDGYLAGDDAMRTRDFIDALNDAPDVIWAARGGYGAGRIAHEIAKHCDGPLPVLVGFSDTTVLHCLWQQHGAFSIHAANVSTVAEWDHAARTQLFSMIRGECRSAVLPAMGGEGHAQGPLFVANLTVLASLVGTSVFPDLAGHILVVEDINEAPYRLDRVMSQLHHAGALRDLAGLAIGQCTGDAKYEESVAAIRRGLNDARVAVCFGLPVGHDASSVALPQGVMATMDPTQLTWVRA